MATLVGLDEMYEFVSKKLISASTVSELTVFIEKLLTIKQLKYDLLSLLDHYYEIEKKHSHVYSDSDDCSDSDESCDNNNNFSSSTHYTGRSTVTITESIISRTNNHIRSLYLCLAPISQILSSDLCTKIVSFIPHRSYFNSISLVSIYFNYLVFYDESALIYNECCYGVSVLDEYPFNKESISFIISFNNKLIKFMPKTKVKRMDNIYIKHIDNIESITEIPYYGIKQWVISIKDRDKLQSLSNDCFELELQKALNKNKIKKNDDLILQVVCNSIKGIVSLWITRSNHFVERMSKYPLFVECIILLISDSTFCSNPSFCLTNNRFPNLQYLEIDRVSFKLSDNITNKMYYQLIGDNDVYIKYDKNKAILNGRYDLLILKILKVYRIIATNFVEWMLMNDTLQNIYSNLLSFKCSLMRSGFISMLRLLLKCVIQLKDGTNIEELKEKLLTKESLCIPSSIQWLYLSNIECVIDLSVNQDLMGAQLNNIDSKQIIFPKEYVIPCFCLSIDQHQIFTNWSNIKYPVRFLLFNGNLKIESTNHRNNILNVITINISSTNRNKQYLSIYLNKNDTKHLFAKIITFSNNANIEKMNKKIKIYKIWWNHHNVAKWIKNFGQNIINP